MKSKEEMIKIIDDFFETGLHTEKSYAEAQIEKEELKKILGLIE